MTGPDKKGREALARLADVLIEDLLAAPDEEIFWLNLLRSVAIL